MRLVILDHICITAARLRSRWHHVTVDIQLTAAIPIKSLQPVNPLAARAEQTKVPVLVVLLLLLLLLLL
jgi:hypothetical protein